jgi:hypothetical protein
MMMGRGMAFNRFLHDIRKKKCPFLADFSGSKKHTLGHPPRRVFGPGQVDHISHGPIRSLDAPHTRVFLIPHNPAKRPIRFSMANLEYIHPFGREPQIQ